MSDIRRRGAAVVDGPWGILIENCADHAAETRITIDIDHAHVLLIGDAYSCSIELSGAAGDGSYRL